MQFDPTVDIDRFQILAIIGSISFIVFIVYLVRMKKLREDYSILWLFFGFSFLGVSIWRESLEYISHAMGIAYAPAAIFILLIMCLFMITIQFSIIISKQANQIIKLAQEIALLRQQLTKQSKTDDQHE
ncbi:MAG: DUF2304 domain-containing protein [Flavobacteriales bacterium]